ncbi:MAG: hypothetical protein ACTTG9_05440 [Dialister pneumosintes]
MKSPIKIGIVLIVLCIAIGTMFSFYEHKKIENVSSIYGVIDLETVVKAHPKYSEYFKLEAEYDNLLNTYQAEQKYFISIASNQEKITHAIQGQLVAKAKQEEYIAKVKIKEEELNQGLRQLYEEISQKHSLQTGDAIVSKLSAEDSNQLTNLQLQLSTLELFDVDKQEKTQKIAALLDKRHIEVGSMVGWTSAEVERMESAKSEASKELESYAKTVGEMIMQEQPLERMNHAALINQLPEFDSWDLQWKQRISDKQNQMAVLKKQIMDDIQRNAVSIAQAKNLKMIFAKHEVNINAIDVTGDLVDAVLRDE